MPLNEMDFSLSRETARDQPLRNLGKVTDGASEQGSPLDGRGRGAECGRRPLPDLSTKSPRGGRKVNGPEIPLLRCGNLQSNITQPGSRIAVAPVGGSRRKTPIVAGAADRATDPAEEVTTPAAARASDDLLRCSSVERPRK